MRKVNFAQLLILIFCLCAAGVLTYWRPEVLIIHNRQPLERALSVMDNWEKTGNSSLSSVIVQKLKLDDYVFQSYTNKKDLITLYVGYYYSGKKVGAAHDPQVCYPGQGWKLTDKKQSTNHLKNGMELNYSQIVAELEDKKEQIFYWFQIDDKSTSNTFRQKLVLLQKKILRQGENNAFVRISISLMDKTAEEAQQVLMDFIEEFYPLFISYVDNT